MLLTESHIGGYWCFAATQRILMGGDCSMLNGNSWLAEQTTESRDNEEDKIMNKRHFNIDQS